MEIENWILVASTLFLGAVALFVPYLAEKLKRKLFKPVLKLHFELGPPGCHKTYFSNTTDDLKSVFYFRFEVANIGKSTCKNVENSLENIWRYNSAGQPIKIDDFTPVNLKWSVNPDVVQQSINPGRRIFCNIGHLPTKGFQNTRSKLVNPKWYEGDDLRFIIDLITVLNVQPNCLPPDTYLLQVNTYSENYHTVISYFKISWTGRWKNDFSDLSHELVIEKTNRPDNV